MGRNKKNKSKQSSTNVASDPTEVTIDNPYAEQENATN
jgi:hypothetical protein